MKKPVKPLVDAEADLLLDPVAAPGAAPGAAPEPESENDASSIEAPKKPRTDKQKAAFQKVLETRDANRRARADARAATQEADKALLEEKIVKKAVSIKKKQIKRQIALEDISDDDEPIEEIKKKIAARPRVRAAPVPAAPEPIKIIFV